MKTLKLEFTTYPAINSFLKTHGRVFSTLGCVSSVISFCAILTHKHTPYICRCMHPHSIHLSVQRSYISSFHILQPTLPCKHTLHPSEQCRPPTLEVNIEYLNTNTPAHTQIIYTLDLCHTTFKFV